MKKVIGIIVIILMIPVIISIIGDIDRTPVYPTTEFNIEKLTRISSLDIGNDDIELLKLPNGVGDRWLSDGTIERHVGKHIVTASDLTTYYGAHTTYGYINKPIDYIGYMDTTQYVGATLINSDYDIEVANEAHRFIIHVPREWTLQDIRDYFVGKTLYYQLATDYIGYYDTTRSLPKFIDFYDGGSVIVDDGIIDYTIVGNQARINYIEGNITTVVDGQFKISKPTKIISKSNDLYDYDLSTLPNYLEYGTLPQGTYDNVIEFINNNQNKQIKLFFNDNIQESRYNTYLENDTIIINNDSEVIRIYNNDTYTSTRNLDTDITYKLEGYNILGYIDGEFDNTVLAFFWIIPVLLVGGLIYLLLKRKE